MAPEPNFGYCEEVELPGEGIMEGEFGIMDFTNAKLLELFEKLSNFKVVKFVAAFGDGKAQSIEVSGWNHALALNDFPKNYLSMGVVAANADNSVDDWLR